MAVSIQPLELLECSLKVGTAKELWIVSWVLFFFIILYNNKNLKESAPRFQMIHYNFKILMWKFKAINGCFHWFVHNFLLFSFTTKPGFTIFMFQNNAQILLLPKIVSNFRNYWIQYNYRFYFTYICYLLISISFVIIWFSTYQSYDTRYLREENIQVGPTLCSWKKKKKKKKSQSWSSSAILVQSGPLYIYGSLNQVIWISFVSDYLLVYNQS